MAPEPVVVEEVELLDVRRFERYRLRPEPSGVTVLTGPNGSGKTTVLEAIGYLALQRSLRGSPRQAMVRSGCERGFVRGRVRVADRRVQLEAELGGAGRSRLLVNRRPAPARRAGSDVLPVTIFSPDDLALLQGPPARRRELLDQGSLMVEPWIGGHQDDLERSLRQRNALLRQAAGRADAAVLGTLDVWDERLGTAGAAVVRAREELVEALRPGVERAYRMLSRTGADGSGSGSPSVGLSYRRSWSGELVEALRATRAEDLRRGSTSVGPHHDELEIGLEGRDARQQASQGEQRSLALALRTALHQLVAERRGLRPVLLLDDVFSELDPRRSEALLETVPSGQTLLTTAGPLPPGVAVAGLVELGDETHRDETHRDHAGAGEPTP